MTEAYERTLRALEDDFETADQQAAEAAQAKRALLEQQLQEASSHHGRWLHAIEHPVIPAAAIEHLEQKQAALEVARGAKETTESQRRTLDVAYSKARQAYFDQERQVSAAGRLVDLADKERLCAN